MTHPELEHDGVRLRRWREDDVDTLLQLVTESIGHLAPWMPWVADGYDRAAAIGFLTGSQTAWRDGTAFNFAILGPDGAAVGGCGLMDRIGPGGFEIGYWLHPDHLGRGYATRAAAALVAEAFRLGAKRVEIRTDEANLRSAAIPQRLGFVAAARVPAREPMTSGETGTDIVWRRTVTR